MTCLISCSSKLLHHTFCVMLLLSVFLGGCTGLFRATPEAKLRAIAPVAEIASPQVVGSGPISWTIDMPAVFEDRLLRFELQDSTGRVAQVQESQRPRWDWDHEAPGEYRVRVIVSAANGEEIASRWSRPFRVVPPLNLSPLRAEVDGPLMAGNARVPWTISAQGGVGKREYSFELEHPDGRRERVQAERAGRWIWTPDTPGSYRVRAIVSDARGNQATSRWSEPFQIAPKLTVEALVADQPAPRMAGNGPFTWSVASAGGVGKRSFQFEMETPDSTQIQVQSGTANTWNWTPEEPGRYRVRAIVTDSLGNQETSEWSEPYAVVPALKVAAPVAERPAPQAALTEPIIWEVMAQGGVEPLSYYFELENDGRHVNSYAQETKSALAWRPEMPGSYRMRIRVVDARGNEATGAWSAPYQIAPPLTITAPEAGMDSPQMSESVSIPWNVTAAGGVGEISYHFEWERDGEIRSAIVTGTDPAWTWEPKQAGTYRVRAWMTDTLGNQQKSTWSVPFVVTPRLEILGLKSDKSSPQAAATEPIQWTVDVRGGVTPYSYQFELKKEEGSARFVQQGPETEWIWLPEQADEYKVRVRVVDARGNRLQGEWSAPYRIAPPLHISMPETEQTGSQFLLDNRIDWQVTVGGGIAPLQIVFTLDEADAPQPTEVQQSSSTNWVWEPRRAGHYRVRASLIDALGNRVDSPWSVTKEIRTKLDVTSLEPSKPAPQAALRDTVVWEVETSGGLDPLNYEFSLRTDGSKTVVQRGPAAKWLWRPHRSGIFQVQVRVQDAAGTTRTSAWSQPYAVKSAIGENDLVAFFPAENLSGRKIPETLIGERYRQMLREAGVQLLDPQRLERFMHRHRVRYTGGLSSSVAKALRKEEGVSAVFVTSVESYSDGTPPQVALTSRLVLCDDMPRIAWIDAIGLNGDDSPGLLGLQRVTQSNALIERAMQRLTAALTTYLEEGTAPTTQPVKTLAPQEYYRASDFVTKKPYRLAVVPFLNRYARRNAGFIVPLQLVNILQRQDTLEVIEPGVVREQLLKYRLIMQGGPSLAIADILASTTTLNADLILSGYVFDYQDDVGNPKIDFSTRLFSGPERKIIWWSRSYAAGNDGVFFYDVGRVRSAQVLLKQQTKALSDLLFSP